MKIAGRFNSITVDYKSGDTIVSFATTTRPTVVETQLEKIKDKPLEIKVNPESHNRSLDANALMWACLSDLAKARQDDNWKLYLEMLRKYGEFTYICVKPSAVETVKKQWRECEEIGEIDINGDKAIQLLCYYGSHTYDTKQFGRLLDGIIKEMVAEGLPEPTPKALHIALEKWEIYEKRHTK